jgi:hypothetical protein
LGGKKSLLMTKPAVTGTKKGNVCSRCTKIAGDMQGFFSFFLTTGYYLRFKKNGKNRRLGLADHFL